MAFKPDSPVQAALFEALSTILPEPIALASGPAKVAGAAAKAAKAADDPLAAILRESMERVGTPLAGESGEAVAGSLGQMQGGASLENLQRTSQFFKVDRGGKITPILKVGGEDAKAGKGAVIELTGTGDAVVKDGSVVGKAMQEALDMISGLDDKLESFMADFLK